MYKKYFLLILLSYFYDCKCSRILCIFPIPSISHQVVFRAYTQALIAKGHELVIVTPNPVYEKDKLPKNVVEINTNYTYPVLHETFRNQETIRGVVFPASQINNENFAVYIRLIDMTFKDPEFKKIVTDKEQKFDLIVSEPGYKMPLYLQKVFDAPSIWFSSFYGDMSIFDAVGAPTWHPIIYPNFLRNKIYNLSLWDKLSEIYTSVKLLPTFLELHEMEKRIFHEYFSDSNVIFEDLPLLLDLVFLNVHPMFLANRPVPPNIVFLGGLHLQPIKELPEDIKSYLDSSQRGVIYVSLGTNVFPDKMTPDLLEAFLRAFKALPYDVLWKFNGELENKPKNLRIQKWFPQRDMLFHPNIKVFVTQGGMQSTDEAIDAGVPLVGIPMLVDQWFNVEQYVRLGIGVQVDALTMTADDLENAVRKVANDQIYRENIVRLRTLMNDQPQTPLERAVWWTEYVIRHKGAKHLRNLESRLTWAEYYEFEMLKIVLGALLAVIFTLSLVLVLCIRKCRVKSKHISEKKKKK